MKKRKLKSPAGAKRTIIKKNESRFTPGKLTPEVRKEFLKLLASGNHTVTTAAEALGVSPVSIFKLRRKNPTFAERYNDAMELSVDSLETGLHMKGIFGDRAHPGNLTAIFGILRARRPHMYRENVNVSGRLEGTFAASWASALNPNASREAQAANQASTPATTH